MTTRRYLVSAAVCTAVVAMSAALLSAQRGGGGRTDRPSNKDFESVEYGIGFPAPAGFDIYTAEQPGRYRKLFDQRHVAVLVNPTQPGEMIDIRFSGNLSEADLKGYRDTVDANPPQAKMPGYEKVSLATTKIGEGPGKEAVDYVYQVKQDNRDETVRQLAFLHQGKGFIVTCTAEQKRFDKANKEFGRFLASLQFK